MKCPGQDMRYWTSAAIYQVSCPECHTEVEFYQDDSTRKCAGCGHRFVNPKMDFGCAAYCQYAAQCIGTAPEAFIDNQEQLLKDKVAVEIKRYYKNDFKQISQVSRLAHYAEQIGKREQVNLVVVICSAYLRNTVRSAAVSPAHQAQAQDIQAHSSAADILTRVGARPSLIDQIWTLLSNPEAAESAPLEQRVLADAALVLKVENQLKKDPSEQQTLHDMILAKCTTRSGRQLGLLVLEQYQSR